MANFVCRFSGAWHLDAISFGLNLGGVVDLPRDFGAKKLAKSQIFEIRQRVFRRKMVCVERLDCGAIFAVDSVLFEASRHGENEFLDSRFEF